MFMELMHLIKLDNNWHNATQGTGNNGFSQLMQGPGGWWAHVQALFLFILCMKNEHNEHYYLAS